MRKEESRIQNLESRIQLPEFRIPQAPSPRPQAFPFRLSPFAFRRSPRKAFTLLEVMIVVIIIGIIAAAVVPNLAGSSGGVRIEAAAQQMASIMDYCYTAANSTGRVHGLVFNPDGVRFEIVSEVPPDDDESTDLDEEPRLEPVPVPGLPDRALPDGIHVSGIWFFDQDIAMAQEDQVRILFFPDGTTEFATLSLSDEHENKRQVKLNGLSGTISVETPEEK